MVDRRIIAGIVFRMVKSYQIKDKVNKVEKIISEMDPMIFMGRSDTLEMSLKKAATLVLDKN